MKYKVGDIVKLRDDLIEFYNYGDVNAGLINEVAQKPFEITKIEGGKYFSQGWVANDEMIEGLWEVSKSTEQVSKSEDNSVNSSVKKYKLIDILNKIANGELKEGTKVKWDIFEYTYKKGDCYEEYLERKVDNFDYVDILDDMYLRNLNAEVELIEPQELKECEHEWKEFGRYNIITKEDKHYRRCIKCDLEEDIEPTDNTKIEELNPNNYLIFVDYDKDGNEEYKLDANLAIMGDCSREIKGIISKLNEVIHYINKEDKNE